MASQVMDERDVTEYHFQQLCKLSLGYSLQDIHGRVNYIAVSNKYGLIFAVSHTEIKVVALETIEQVSASDITVNAAVNNFAHDTIAVGFSIQYISLNSDDSIIFIVYQDGGELKLGAVDVAIVKNSNKNDAVFTSLTLVNASDICVNEVQCHPELPTLSALVLSNGHVLMIELDANNQLAIASSLTPTTPVTSVCWSPKGKQIVVGDKQGNLIQYDKTLQVQKKVTPPPEIDMKSVGGLYWISSYLFFVVYHDLENVAEPPIVTMVTTQKEGQASYSILNDIYYGFCEERSLCFYFSYIPGWNLMISMASNAMEAAPVGKKDEKWQRWALLDTGRAEMPLTAGNEDTYPVGIGICLNSRTGIELDDKELPPAPVYVMLSTDGVLCSYRMVNQFPQTDHSILTQVQPFPTTKPRRGTPSSFAAPSTAIPAPSNAMPPPFNAMTAPSFNFSNTASNSFGNPTGNSSFKFAASVVNSSQSLTFGGAMSTPASNSNRPVASASAMPTPAGALPTPTFALNTAPSFLSKVVTDPNSKAKEKSSGFPITSFSFTGGETNQKPFGSVTGPAFNSQGFPTFSTDLPTSSKPAEKKGSGASTFVFTTPKTTLPLFGSTTPNPNTIQTTGFQLSGNTAESARSVFTPLPQPANEVSALAPLSQPTFFQQTNTPVVSQPYQLQVSLNRSNGTLSGFSTTGVLSKDTISSKTTAAQSVLSQHQEYILSQKQKADALSKPPSQAQQISQPPLVSTPLSSQVNDQIQPPTSLPVTQISQPPLVTTPLSSQLNDPTNPPTSVTATTQPVTEEDKADQDIAQQTAHLHAMLEKDIVDEIRSFNTEIINFQQSISELTNKKDLIGTQQELVDMKNEIEKLDNFVYGHKLITKENKLECNHLREEVLKHFKLVDEAELRKQKNEDQRYSTVLRTRPLDPISTRQRKQIRNQYNQLEHTLQDVNALLDAKWEEKEVLKKRGRSRNVSHNQQIFKTVEAIEKITTNLSQRVENLTLQSQETQLLSMNITHRSNLDRVNLPNKSADDEKAIREKLRMQKSNAKQLSMLKNYLSNRSTTPVRKPKQYALNYNGYDTTLQTPSFQSLHPKAASTPAITYLKNEGHAFSTMKAVPEEKAATLSSALANVVNGSSTPSVLHNVSGFHHPTKAPENTPVTPDILGQSSRETPNKSYNTEPVNKNLFGLNTGSGDPKFGNPFAGNPGAKSGVFNSPGPKDKLPAKLQTDSSSKLMPITTNQAIFSFSTPVQSSKPVPGVSQANSLAGANAGFSFNFKNPVGSICKTEVLASTTTTTFKKTNALYSPGKSDNLKDLIESVSSSNMFTAVDKYKISIGSAATSASGGLLGATATPNVSGIPFGSTATTSVSGIPFGSTATTSASGGSFGFTATTNASGGLFGSTATTGAPGVLFGSTATTSASGVPFGSTTTTSVSGIPFGSTATTSASGGSFGSTATTSASGGLFGLTATTSASEGLFGLTATPSVSEGLLGSTATKSASGGLFGSTATPSASEGLFGSTTTSVSVGLFGSTATTSGSGGLFVSTATTSASGKLFGSTATTSALGGLFGSTATTSASGGLFGLTTTPSVSEGLLGSTATTSASGGLFGSTATPSVSGGLFGSTATTSESGGLFGATATSASGGLFGSTATKSASGGLFGSTATPSASGGLFGSTTTSVSGGLFGSTATTSGSGGLFVSTATTSASGKLFGSTATASASGGLFGLTTTPSVSEGLLGSTATTSASGGLFGSTATPSVSGGLFGSTATTSESGGLFGATATSASGGLFGSTATKSASGGLFGSTATTSESGVLFGATATSASGGLFGSTATTSGSAGLFGSTATKSASGGLFGSTATPSASGGLFGSTTTSVSGGLFGSTATTSGSGGLFVSTTTTSASGKLFGSTATTSASGGLFGLTTTPSVSEGLFGSTATTSGSGGLFGSTATPSVSGGLFGSTATPSVSGGLFGSTATTSGSGGLFGSTATPSVSGGLFGSTATTSASGGLFATSTSVAPAFGSNSQQTSSGGFGGFGLGGKPMNDPNKNPFGTISSTSNMSDSSQLFGTSTNSVFGQPSITPSFGSGSFSRDFGSGLASQQQQASSFGLSSPPQASAPAFGAPAAFGSPPSFGGAPAFGASPSFGSGGGAVFGSAGTTQGPVFGSGGGGGTTFGSLAGQTTGGTTFGSLAGQTTGGAAFGSLANQVAPSFGQLSTGASFGSSGHGEFGNNNSQGSNTSSFSSWR
ncbi:nuclear pore complex protein DDB_G0274915-like [Hydractinia symbiolongicarpus]|uniref:nuclear pore complex protein DDB_G0274915-like n=1 Tax=Hydractinia symbiolongicarpus TaxID=13093 RepID=UPI00254BD568|nr:nuclear pore complex protein DDB_G0274915-like [Hydractinia symbiolongicarpus]